MDRSKVSSVGLARGIAMIVIVAMAIVVAKYLFDTYRGTGLLVAVLATVLVVVTAGIPYWVHRRRCAREAARDAAQPV